MSEYRTCKCEDDLFKPKKFSALTCTKINNTTYKLKHTMLRSLKRPRSVTLLSIAGILLSIQSVLQLNLVQFGLFDFNSTQQNGGHSENVSESSRLDNEEEIDNEEADIFYRRYLISNNNILQNNNNKELVEDFDTAAEYAQQDSTTLRLPNPSPDELASGSQLVVQPYSISDALHESSLWEYTFCILGELFLFVLVKGGRLVKFFFGNKSAHEIWAKTKMTIRIAIVDIVPSYICHLICF